MKLRKILLSMMLVLSIAAASAALPGGTGFFMKAAAEGGKVTITGTSVNVRSGAGTNYSRFTEVKSGQSYLLLDTVKDSKGATWYKISIQGREGYVSAAYAKTDVGTTQAPQTTSSQTTVKTTQAQTTTTTASTQKQIVTVTGTNVNIRSGAGTKYGKLTTANKGAQYDYLGSAKASSGVTWYKISVGGKTGYICSSYAKVSSVTVTTTAPATKQIVTVTGDPVNVRSGADTSKSKIAVVHKGEKYDYLGSAKDSSKTVWYKISVGGKTGYIISTYAKVSTVSVTTTTTAKATTKATTAGTTAASGTVLTATAAGGVYANPTASSRKVADMKAGEVYSYTSTYVGGDKVKWYLVNVDGASGWTSSKWITEGDKRTTTTTKTTTTTASTTKTTTTGATAAPTQNNAVTDQVNTVQGKPVTANGAAEVYASPTVSAKKVATLTGGKIYYYTSTYVGGDNVKWYLVNVDGTTGWVCSKYLTEGEVLLTTTTSTTTTTAATTTTTTTTAAPTTTTTAKPAGKPVAANNAAGVYASPTTSAKKVTTLKAGSVYYYTNTYVGGDKVKWYLLTADGHSGWVCGSSLTEGTATTSQPTKTTAKTTAAPAGKASVTTVKTGTVKTSGSALAVRATASTSASKIGTVKSGTKVTILGETTGTKVSGTTKWYKIQYGSSTGYVSSAYVTSITSSNSKVTMEFGASYFYVNQGEKVSAAINGLSGITYKSSNSTNAPISSSGVVTGKAAGLYHITATYGSTTAEADVVVLTPAYGGISPMTPSDKLVDFIAGWEGGGTYVSGLGNVFYPYKDCAGYWTIGYGHARTTTESKSWSESTATSAFNTDITELIGKEHCLTKSKPYLTQAEATMLLKADLIHNPYTSSVSDWAIRNGVKLTQSQFDSLVSFAFNMGPSYWTSDSKKFYLKSAIICKHDGNLSDPNQIIEGFTRYIKAGGDCYKGLWWRRRNEAEMFLTGDYAIDRDNKFKLPTNISWAA